MVGVPVFCFCTTPLTTWVWGKSGEHAAVPPVAAALHCTMHRHTAGQSSSVFPLQAEVWFMSGTATNSSTIASGCLRSESTISDLGKVLAVQNTVVSPWATHAMQCNANVIFLLFFNSLFSWRHQIGLISTSVSWINRTMMRNWEIFTDSDVQFWTKGLVSCVLNALILSYEATNYSSNYLLCLILQLLRGHNYTAFIYFTL